MSEIWRHLKIDLRRCWWLLAGLLAVLLFFPGLALGGLGLGVADLVMNHKPAGSRAWWLVRPFSRTRLALAKFLEIALLCAAVYIVLSVRLLVQGYDPGLVALCKLEEVPAIGVLFGLSAVLACLSRDAQRFFLLLGGVLIFGGALATSWFLLVTLLAIREPGMEIPRWIPSKLREEGDAWFVITLLTAIGLFTVLVYYYRKRRLSWTILGICSALLIPLYLVTVLFPRNYDPLVNRARGDFVPSDWSVALQEKEITAEKFRSVSRTGGEKIPLRRAHWSARVPLEFHSPEPLPDDESLYFTTHVSFGSPDDRSIDEKTEISSWRVHRKTASLHAAGVVSAEPVDDGRTAESKIRAVYEHLFDRPLEVRMETQDRLLRSRALYAGEMRLTDGAEMNDGANRFRLRFYEPYSGNRALVLKGKALRPRTESNPAWRFIRGRYDHTCFLWDDRNSVAHFPRSLSTWRNIGDGETGFFNFSFPGVDLHRTGDLRLLVIGHAPVARGNIKIEPGTFVIRRPNEIDPE